MNTSKSVVNVQERSDYKVIEIVLPSGKIVVISVNDNGTVMVDHNAFDPELKRIVARMDKVTINIEAE